MSRRTFLPRPAAWLASLALALGLTAPAHADDALARFPSLHGDSVVFEAHGNLWEVSRNGGEARRLTAEPGYDLMPRFSPDGKWIAFTGQYEANTDVYVIRLRAARLVASPSTPTWWTEHRNAGDRTTWCWAGRRTRRT